MDDIVLYHASKQVVEFPEVRKTKFTKDFSWGFTVPRICSKLSGGQIEDLENRLSTDMHIGLLLI